MLSILRKVTEFGFAITGKSPFVGAVREPPTDYKATILDRAWYISPRFATDKRLLMIISGLIIVLSVAWVEVVRADITVEVTKTADTNDGLCDADCSLREAITAANANSDTTTINFNIPGSGVHTIQPTTALPAITAPAIIDGSSQPGYNGTPLIELDGSLLPAFPPANGFWVTAGNSTIKALIINRFTFGGITLDTGGGNTIVGNYIGTDSSGTLARGNRDGVYISNSSNNTVGGAASADRNLISGNTDDGVNFAGSSGGDSNTVQGNYIGTDVTGTLGLPNAGDGVKISEASDNNLIGGTTSGAGNLIAFNNLRGIYAEQITLSPTGNRILGNSIFSNNALGVDLKGDGITANDLGDGDTGANGLQNFPVLTTAYSSTGAIIGTLNSAVSTTFRLEFFANPVCDSSGSGEGKTYLGFVNVTTDSSGNAAFTTSLSTTISANTFITATATDPANNTSEFSACLTPQSAPTDSPQRNYFTTSTPTLTWKGVTGAAGYELQVDNDLDFSSPAYQDDTLPAAARSATTTPLSDDTYYWRVRSKNAQGLWGNWSAIDTFVIDTP